MTLIVAMRCTDGVLLASESGITDPELNMKWVAKGVKQRLVADHQFIAGMAGDGSVCGPCMDAFADSVRGDSFKELKEAVSAHVKPIQRKALKDWEEVTTLGREPAGEALVVAVRGGNAATIALSRCGAIELQPSALHRFSAAGSGAQFAYGCYYAYGHELSNLAFARVFVARLMQDATSHVAGLEMPVHIDEITLQGIARTVPTKEIQALLKRANDWRKRQQAPQP